MGQYGKGYTGASRSRLSPPSGDDSSTWIYSDLDFVFKPSPIAQHNGIWGDVAKKYDGDSIKQSVKNILLSNKHERPWKPQFGPGLRELLFENVGSASFFLDVFEKRQDIRRQLSRYEPRIEVVSVDTSVDELGSTLSVSVDYKLKPIQKDSVVKKIIVKVIGERIR